MRTFTVFGKPLALVVVVASMLGPSPARAAVSGCDRVDIASTDLLSEPREEQDLEVEVRITHACDVFPPQSFYVQFSSSRPDLIAVQRERSSTQWSANTFRIPVGTVNADTPVSVTVELEVERRILSSRTLTFTIRDVPARLSDLFLEPSEVQVGGTSIARVVLTKPVPADLTFQITRSSPYVAPCVTAPSSGVVRSGQSEGRLRSGRRGATSRTAVGKATPSGSPLASISGRARSPS